MVVEDQEMGRVICVANQKGVAKTTTAVNLCVLPVKAKGALID